MNPLELGEDKTIKDYIIKGIRNLFELKKK